MTQDRWWNRLALGRAAWIGALLLGALVGPARAQQSGSGSGSSSDPNADNEPVHVSRPRGFRLFGLGDFALTGMRQGGRSTWKVTNQGPSDDAPTLDADLPGRVIGTASSPNGYCCGYFELQLWMASARGDWARARDQIPSLENARGGGWNARTQLSRWVTDLDQLVFTGRDASIGTFFSGARSESGTGTCQDNSGRPNDVIGPGFSLLAGSDCPPTWVGTTFAGERPVADTTWIRRFQTQGANFRFDDWRVPLDQRADRLYGSFQTFGATNDYGREIRAKAGNVLPNGVGRSKLEGYPMGIEWEFQAWTYAVPTIGDAMFYKANVINKSAEVYGGQGINYDSLFLGFMVRPFHTTGTQAPAVYAAPARGAVLTAQSNVNGQSCYGNKTKGTDIRSCTANSSTNRGFRGGGGALVIFKSPIGDLRNKLFSTPTSPFYSPSHPAAGDTLTYNLATTCGFTCSTEQITPGKVRAVYGALTGSESDALAGRGRSSQELTERQYHDLFRNPDWPVRWSATSGTRGGFARWVPPTASGVPWDYNHDGVADTLKVTTCWDDPDTPGPGGCVTPFTDTLPGGFPDNIHNNYFAGVGPIKLKAGDTTSFIVAFVSTPDSVSLERHVDNITSLYLDFWLSPQPPTPVNIVSASVVGGNRQFDTEVRLFLDQSANEQTDPFLIEFARKLKASRRQEDVRLLALNPQLINDIRARALPVGRTLTDTVPRDTLIATANLCASPATFTTARCLIVTRPTLGVVDSLVVFKSCDLGNTYTSSSGRECTPSPARDVAGNSPGGFAWQSYARLARDASGRFPAVYRDGNVTAGVTYTYVIVEQSFPAIFTVTDVGAGGALTTRDFIVRPKTTNALTANTANRNVAVVYVPASRQAGSDTSALRFLPVTTAGSPARDTLAAFLISTRLAKPVRGSESLQGRIVYSDSAEVVVYDADTTTGGITSTTVRLFALVDSAVSGTTVSRRIVARRDTFLLKDTVPVVDVAGRFGTTATRKDSVVPGTPQKFTIYRFAGPPASGVRPQVTLVVNGRPVFVTDTIPAGTDITPPTTLMRRDFPGVLVTLDPSRQRTLNTTFWEQPGIGNLNSPAFPTLRWLPGTSRDVNAFSRYKFTFSDREFGPDSPFRLDPRAPQALRDAYTASLGKRTETGKTDASAGSAAAIASALGRPAITADSLAVLDIPFKVTNVRLDRPVTVAVLKSEHPATALLGSGGDTIRVSVPADKWIPGDRLYFVERVPVVAYDTVSAPGATPVRTRVRLTNGVPDTVSALKVTWGPTQLGCDVPASPVTPASTCNPVEGLGGTGYTHVNKNAEFHVLYYAPIGGLTSLPFTLEPERVGAQVVSVAAGDLKNVRVVPNPYIMFSEYEQTRGTKRLLFTNLPPTGVLRIYTAAGQFVQQIKWIETDLERNCRATTMTTDCTATGDLQWNMRSKENLEVGPGFYVFVVTTEIGKQKRQKIGKFVIIH